MIIISMQKIISLSFKNVNKALNNKKSVYSPKCSRNHINSSDTISCLKIILCYSEIKDFEFKNEDSLTPYELANKNGYFQLCKIIEDYEKNIIDQNITMYKMSFYNESERYYKKGYNDLNFYTLDCFTHCDYENCIVNLKN